MNHESVLKLDGSRVQVPENQLFMNRGSSDLDGSRVHVAEIGAVHEPRGSSDLDGSRVQVSENQYCS